MSEQALQAVRAAMGAVRVASPSDKVYKDECVFSFASALSEGGLYINLQTFQAVGEKFLELDSHRSDCALYLHKKQREVPIETGEEPSAPTKLAIGVEGGFQTEASKTRIETDSALVVLPSRDSIALPNLDVPQIVLDAIAAVEAHESTSMREEVEAWQEQRLVSKYAENLEQLPCEHKIPMNPAEWKCAETGATENLWLNLSTGFIGSGRQHWDGTGGNGAALRHFEATGSKYPLVVKLGTITPTSADVYSYAPDEDDMVTDPKLAEHLAHWGINILQMEKTEKTMTELQIEKNIEFEANRITEEGESLVPLHGPGYTGLVNLGNSCYMNSVLQVLWSLKETGERYLPHADAVFGSAPRDVPADLLSQWCKVGRALVLAKTGDVRRGEDGELKEADAVRPGMFKALVGRGHPEFSSNRQQDAEEYVGHLLELLSRAERAGAERLSTLGMEPGNLGKLFEFRLEDRIQCSESKKVLYKYSPATTLSLNVPMEAAINLMEIEERKQKRQRVQEEGGSSEGELDEVVPRVPLQACLDAYAADATVADYFSPALQRKTEASKRVRIASFPSYLLVQVRRYYVDRDWTQKKLEVEVDVPDVLSLDALRASGLRPDEEPMPEDRAPEPEADPELVQQLASMGFPEPKCRKASLAVGNSSAEAAMEWLLTHMDDPEETSGAGGGPAAAADPAAISSLEAMGFSTRQATAALSACDGSLERAADWLFCRMDDLDAAVAAVEAQRDATPAPQSSGSASIDQGPARYELHAFISHIGRSTGSGHYVCHIRKEGRWVIYNDEKVAVSANPPRDLGYLYVFKRSA